MCVLPTAYLGPQSYYRALLQTDEAEIEAWESFPKRTYRNRCRIAGVNGVQTLTIPVEKCDSKQWTKDVKIVYRQPWQQQHWMALRSAYEHTPYFEYLEDRFRPYYEREVKYLLDWNMMLMEEVLRIMDAARQSKVRRPQLTDQWRGRTDESVWSDKGEEPPYYQVFASRHGFENNLSIVDRLFNMGLEGLWI